jgi:hypothetical protein
VTPSTDRIRSPGLSSCDAGLAVTLSTRLFGTWMPLIISSDHRIRNASTMFTAGPAPITTIRFHTGWRK